MKKPKDGKALKKSIILLLAMLFVLVGMSVYAENDLLTSNLSYYVATDENGVQQVFQLVLDGGQEARQLSHAEQDVITFGVAYDALGIVYISNGQLWLQSVHSEEAEALATVTATRFFKSPIFSQDGNYIAYADNGVWLYDLANRQTHQILADVPLEEMASNANEYQVFQPEAFVANPDGTVSKLIVDVGIWEWETAGVYDLVTGQFLMLEGRIHTSVLALSDGRALVYGNSAMDGEAALHLADSLDTINSFIPILYFQAISDATLFAQDAVEIAPGLIRVLGSGITFAPAEPSMFYFYLDFDLNTGIISDVYKLDLSEPDKTDNTIAGEVSSNGNVVSVYLNALYSDAGTIYGDFKLVNLLTGETIPAPFPDVVGVFHLQP